MYENWSKSQAVQPTGTSLHPDKAHKNEYHDAWNDHKRHYGFHEKISGPGPKTMILMGHGANDEIGKHHEFHHNQTGARIGTY